MLSSGREEAMRTQGYFPKKTDLATISDKVLNKALDDINHRPRKCLAYRTVCESLEDEFE